MFGNIAAERAAIEMLYEDSATIERPTVGTKGDGSALSKHGHTPIASDVICGLSRAKDGSKQTDKQLAVDVDMVLFAPPETDVADGDRITVKRFGRIDPTSKNITAYEVVGLTLVYATHQEIPLKHKGLG